MKHIIYTLCCMAVAFFMTACSEDYSTPESESDLAIVKSDVSFGPEKGSGTIETSGSRAITATSNAWWCKPEVKGNTVEVAVNALSAIQSRTATITITDGLKKIDVPVHQDGSILRTGFQTYISGYQASNFDLKVKSNTEYTTTITLGDDWITMTKNDNGLHFELPQNTTGKDRAAQVIIKTASNQVDTIQIAQSVPTGDYTAYFISTDENGNQGQYQLNVNVGSNGYITGFGLPVPYEINGSYFSIPTTYVGKTGGYYYYTVVLDSNGQAYLPNQGLTYDAMPTLTKDGHLALVFVNTSNTDIAAFALAAFTSQPPTQVSYYGTGNYFANLTLIKK